MSEEPARQAHPNCARSGSLVTPVTKLRHAAREATRHFSAASTSTTMSSQLMHVSPSSPISTLPHELLEAILYQFVFSSDTGPVVLTEVCRHWRDIVYGSGRLWSQIDLQRPEAAKTHLKYAQGCALDVQWLNRSYGPGHPQAEYREWFWTESHRISTLILVHTSKTLSTIFSSMDPALPQLAELTLIAQDPAANLQVPLDIQNYTPQLTVLSLSYASPCLILHQSAHVRLL